MTNAEQREAARKFINTWKNKGDEKSDTQSFWISLLSDVLGLEDVTNKIDFEKRVTIDGQTKYIDGYIVDTKVLIEQKSINKKLDKAIPQSGGTMFTPYEQAKNYANNLPFNEMPRWIVTCNFQEFNIYDMNKPGIEPEVIKLANLQDELYRLSFLMNVQVDTVSKEMEISIQAGEIVGELYDELLKQYEDPTDENSLKSLNALCVRLVFCLYAEDAGVFGKHGLFHDYLLRFDIRDLRRAIIDLFKILDTKPEDRDRYLDDELKVFPYVNGGLFADDNIEIPQFTENIRELILKKASADFDWSKISPTIFGAVFESTLNPETRRAGGMHYTSIENIHKVIDPLFLDDLKDELEEILKDTVLKTRDKKLKAFQKKIANLTFLDPACGSGNFLTETYISLRRLENKALQGLSEVQIEMNTDKKQTAPIQVSINQFYGIEINDFAVTVAQAAMWIAESQMMQETEDVIHIDLDFLPLDSYVNIIEGNALRMDWNDIISAKKLSFIMGNPPFVGQALRTKEQTEDMQKVFYPSKVGGKLDYVSSWFKKAADYTRDTDIEVAFVASNSICQGESVNLLWELLLTSGIVINFAHTTFKWVSEAKAQAAVMCIIVGFSYKDYKEKLLYIENQKQKVSHINGYLNAAPDVFIKNRNKSINAGLAKVVQGSPPADNGRLMLDREEREYFIKKYPKLEKVIKPFLGSREFLNDIEYSRFCFWFVGEQPSDYADIPELIERFDYIKKYRNSSSVDRIQKTAEKPWLFTQNRQPLTNYILIPRHSSGERRYIPMGYMTSDIICSDAVVVIDGASLYDFGILSSNVHNAWTRTVCGRLKADYRYAPSVYYNFPLPKLTDESKEQIEETAKEILEARKIYKTKTLAEMYGKKMYMYPELQVAHRNNDRAVMKAYGFDIKEMSEADCVAELMKMYQKLVEK